jgi:transposase
VDLNLRIPVPGTQSSRLQHGLLDFCLSWTAVLFYKTRNGAKVGDLFMSLIHTCELNGADPFDYLNQLQRHAEEVKQTPSEWMPWNYRATLARTGALLNAA